MEHSTTTTGSYNSDNSETNIFLGINISIVVVLLICILGYCYFFRNRFDAIIRHNIELNNEALEQTIRDRRMERERAIAATQQQRTSNNMPDNDGAGMDRSDEVEESTDCRRDRLVDSFIRNKVTMVRSWPIFGWYLWRFYSLW